MLVFYYMYISCGVASSVSEGDVFVVVMVVMIMVMKCERFRVWCCSVVAPVMVLLTLVLVAETVL